MEKKVKWMTQFSKLFAKAMKKIGRSDYKKLENMYRNRYMDYLCSDEYEEYREHGSIELEIVYAAIAHTKICLEIGIALEEAMRIWEEMMIASERKNRRMLCSLIDNLKNGYKMAANHLEKEARKHKADESMTFEVLKRDEEKLEVKISRCVYVEIFEAYGLRELCRVFCNNIHCLDAMEKSAKFEKYSSLLDGECCHMLFSKR